MIKLPKASRSYKTSNDSDFGASFASLYTEDQMWAFAEEYAASSMAPSVLTAMRRYTPDYNAGMNEDLEGDYVLFADARNANNSLFSQANKRIVELEKQTDAHIAAAAGLTTASEELRRRYDARIAELEADRRVLQSTGEHPAPCARHCEANAFRIELRNKDARIAELEKQAAIDKTLLALADARINRELRDDFAGRALQGILAQPGMTVDIDGDYIGQARAGLAYGMADALLKAKGGA